MTHESRVSTDSGDSRPEWKLFSQSRPRNEACPVGTGSTATTPHAPCAGEAAPRPSAAEGPRGVLHDTETPPLSLALRADLE